ncbi:NeuD/PglB/VioB family sugar acetyltransferase [Mesorhizobium sp. M0243]|uniref:NeuD/PglB/VioB family sugar acetyltransferase n=1 Tax=Mesorhizobium sp. M0243 TaxID=2956925 RepID=UPI003335CFAD
MKVVIFGDGPFASLVWHCLTHDSSHLVAAFTVERAFLSKDRHNDLPVHAFEDIEESFDPSETAIAVAIGPHDNNRVRARLLDQVKARGFQTISYLASRAIAASNLAVEENTFIFDGAVIQPFATVGGNCIIRSAAHVSHHVQVADRCFIAAGACIGGSTTIGVGTFIGLNATIHDNIEIAPNCVISAGSVLTRSTQAGGIYVGAPARRLRQS